jgi:hypothetical protein
MELSCQLHIPARFTSEERAPGTHWIGDWVGPRVSLDAVEEKQILHCRESNPGRPARGPFLYWAIPAPAPIYKLF